MGNGCHVGCGYRANTATFSFGNDAEREAVTAFYAHAIGMPTGQILQDQDG